MPQLQATHPSLCGTEFSRAGPLGLGMAGSVSCWVFFPASLLEGGWQALLLLPGILEAELTAGEIGVPSSPM